MIEDSAGALTGLEAIESAVAAYNLVGGRDAARETNDEDRCRQRGSKTNLTKPRGGIEDQPMPKPALLSRFQPFLQPHARSRNQIGRRLLDRQLGEHGVKLACRLELSSAVRAPRQMLFEFITRVIGQLVVDVQQNVFFNPLAFHNHTPSGETLISYPPARPAISESHETKYSSPFLPSYATPHPRSAA